MRSLRRGVGIPMLSDEEIMAVETGDPYIFLDALRKMGKRPDWAELCFDWESLKWIARAWREAAMAAVGDTNVRDACLKEEKRYAYLAKQLELGMLNSNQSAIMIMDSLDDWPHEQVVLGAMRALRHAEIPVVA